MDQVQHHLSELIRVQAYRRQTGGELCSQLYPIWQPFRSDQVHRAVNDCIRVHERCVYLEGTRIRKELERAPEDLVVLGPHLHHEWHAARGDGVELAHAEADAVLRQAELGALDLVELERRGARLLA